MYAFKKIWKNNQAVSDDYENLIMMWKQKWKFSIYIWLINKYPVYIIIYVLRNLFGIF